MIVRYRIGRYLGRCFPRGSRLAFPPRWCTVRSKGVCRGGRKEGRKAKIEKTVVEDRQWGRRGRPVSLGISCNAYISVGIVCACVCVCVIIVCRCAHVWSGGRSFSGCGLLRNGREVTGQNLASTHCFVVFNGACTIRADGRSCIHRTCAHSFPVRVFSRIATCARSFEPLVRFSRIACSRRFTFPFDVSPPSPVPHPLLPLTPSCSPSPPPCLRPFVSFCEKHA